MIVGVLGRFQPFHWGHFDYVWEASRGASHLIIGVTEPIKGRHYQSNSAPHRATSTGNPLSYNDREAMISAVCTEYMPEMIVSIQPCPLDRGEEVAAVFSSCDALRVTVYDDWGLERVQLLESFGLNVEVLWTRTDKLICGSAIRERIRGGEAWAHLVPKPVFDVVSRVMSSGSGF